jgi:outer membrane receptor protein involved in Fe transport
VNRHAFASRQSAAPQQPESFRLSPVAAAAVLTVMTLATGSVMAQTQAAAPQGAASAPAATADEAPRQLEGIVVRSRNRIEKLQDVPLSVSVVTGTELSRLDATGINEVIKRAGNVSWNQGNQRTSSLSIRGIGKVGQTEAQDPSVGVMVDGVYYAYNALTSSFDFTDVENLEVTRGPQGTLLGKNASLGIIAINTRKPSFTPSADYSLAFKQRDGFTGTLAAGGPVIDDLLAWRGAFSVSRQKGDLVNSYDRDRTYGNTDRVSGRVQFLLTPTPDFNARLAFDAQPRAAEFTNGRTINTPTPATYADGSANTAVSNETRLGRRWFTQNQGYSLSDYLNGGADGNSVNNDSARPLVTGSHGASAELNWKLGDGHALTSITAYKDYHFNAYNDEGTPFDVSRNSGGFWNDYKQFSQELRLSSPVGGFVDYQTGLYFIRVHNNATYNKGFGNDAGAWYANNAQYSRLDADAAGRQLLTNSLANLQLGYNSPAGTQDIQNRSGALYGQANWHLSEPLTLTTGLRLTSERRTNTSSSYIISNGSGAELNPASVNGVNLGGFNSDSKGNPAQQQALADSVAKKYFGSTATYGTLTAAQKQQIADAKTIRAGQIGVLFPSRDAEQFNQIQHNFVLSPSYKVSPDLTTYFSWQYGEKAGISQFVNGNSFLVSPEKTNSFELGFKSLLLDKTLVLNADIFLTKVKDFQQSVRVVDDYTTALNNDGKYYYTGATGNVPKVQAHGIEIDGVYTGIRNTTLRFSGAYNRAVYKDFPNSAQPNENGYNGAPAYQNVSGSVLAGALKFSGNIGADYRLPVFSDKELHTSANVAFTSGFYSDNSLSSYSWIKKNYVVDWAIGLGRRDKAFDVSLVVKNLLNDDTPQAKTWNTITPALPRTFSIVLTGKL